MAHYQVPCSRRDQVTAEIGSVIAAGCKRRVAGKPVVDRKPALRRGARKAAPEAGHRDGFAHLDSPRNDARERIRTVPQPGPPGELAGCQFFEETITNERQNLNMLMAVDEIGRYPEGLFKCVDL